MRYVSHPLWLVLAVSGCTTSTGVSVTAALVLSDDPSEQWGMFRLDARDCSGSHEDDDVECEPHEGLDAKAGAKDELVPMSETSAGIYRVETNVVGTEYQVAYNMNGADVDGWLHFPLVVPDDVAIDVERVAPATARLTWPTPVTSIWRRQLTVESFQGEIRVGSSQVVEGAAEQILIAIPEGGAFVLSLRTKNDVLGGCYETPDVGITGELTLERRIAISAP
jgi:hypothetical protein